MTGSGGALSAIILAAGLSSRMGQPKMLLPWGKVTIIEQVVTTILDVGIDRLIVVTGSGHQKIRALLAKYPSHVQLIFNPLYADGEMLHSLQAGMAALDFQQSQAVLIVLGDQPQIQVSTVKGLIQEYESNPSLIIIPSYRMHRGHPWLIGKELWGEILALKLPRTLRDLLNDHSSQIQYLNLDTPTILSDLDTPEDYKRFRP
jgi:molybdenum cofactor cytidylyltransferase